MYKAPLSRDEMNEAGIIVLHKVCNLYLELLVDDVHYSVQNEQDDEEDVKNATSRNNWAKTQHPRK